jgi:hypothetical protein
MGEVGDDLTGESAVDGLTVKISLSGQVALVVLNMRVTVDEYNRSHHKYIPPIK